MNIKKSLDLFASDEGGQVSPPTISSDPAMNTAGKIVGVIVLALVGLLLWNSIGGSVQGTLITNQSIGTFSGNVSVITVGNPAINEFESFVFRNQSTTLTRNESFDHSGCSNTPCYRVISFQTGQLNVTLGYRNNASSANVTNGQADSTDPMFGDYRGGGSLTDTDSNRAVNNVRTTGLSAMELVAIMTIIIAASALMLFLNRFGGIQ